MTLTRGQANFLKHIEAKEEFDFWKTARHGHSADIMASPEQLDSLVKMLNDNHIGYEVMIEDVEELDMKTRFLRNKMMPRPVEFGKISFEDYHSHDEVRSFDHYLMCSLPAAEFSLACQFWQPNFS